MSKEKQMTEDAVKKALAITDEGVAIAEAAQARDDDVRATVTLCPVPGAFISGVPAVECEVSAREAKRLLKFKPPAFTKAPPRESQE